MTASKGRRLELTPRRYRWLDRGSKLAGLGLIVAGLEVGGGTVTGLVLAALGVAIGVVTVFIDSP